VKPLLEAAGLWNGAFDGGRREWLQRVLALVLSRVRRLPDFVDQVRPFLAGRVDYDSEAVAKYLAVAELDSHVEALAQAFDRVERWVEAEIERALREVADARTIKAATLIHAARIATTGKAVSPGIFEVLALMGKSVTVTRLVALVEFLRTR
jgi:glutamyl-tRNA synthetase